jgi:xanthosine utilization system XapX-like protein
MLPVIVLLGLLGVFVVSRFAYWRWAIHRSRRQVATSFDPPSGKPAATQRYVLYRGTRRWGK